ncbi:MAG TPA: sporulation protein YpjB [Bacillales bacterium]|nr:sporulation protein YpjB [Bacillales bacterium]
MRLLTCILLAAIFMFPNTAYGQETSSHAAAWDKFAETAGKALQLVKDQKYAEAKQMLEYFEKQFRESQKSLNLSMMNLRILSTTHDHAMRAVTNVSASQETRETIVTQFYLVVDALRSESQPLWLSTRNQVMTPFGHMKEAAKTKNDRAFQFYLNQFLSKYNMIYPALNVDLKESLLGRLDSEVQYVENHRIDYFSEPNYIEHLNRMEKDFNALYDGTLKDSMEPTLPWVILSIGGIIVLALFYSGWQKYKAELRARDRRKKAKKRS